MCSYFQITLWLFTDYPSRIVCCSPFIDLWRIVILAVACKGKHGLLVEKQLSLVLFLQGGETTARINAKPMPDCENALPAHQPASSYSLTVCHWLDDIKIWELNTQSLICRNCSKISRRFSFKCIKWEVTFNTF